MFIENLKETLGNEFNVSVTENGANGFRTTGNALLDINSAVSSMRSMSEQEIADRFVKVFYEDKLLAVKWLFFARDARGGLGERRLFRVCFKYLAEKHVEIARAVLPLVAEYGRYDDLLCLLDTSLADEVVELVKQQLDKDMQGMKEGKPISLLAKWLPSANTSSKETRRLAHILICKLGISERQYRKLLSKLRSYLKVVEVAMSKKEWGSIDYSAVPSRANLVYNSAFLRNDEDRRRAFLGSLQKGETSINAGVLFPHDVVHGYCGTSKYYDDVKSSDNPALEEMWKALPDFVEGAGNTICVADGSGSMYSRVGRSRVTALEVANALAIYFAERSSGQFKDTYITFSEHPQLVDLSTASSLREKIEIARRYDEVANTNIEAVFELILQTAISSGMSQNELPQNILILSDMEFDQCVRCSEPTSFGINSPTKRLFEVFAEKYASYGYKLPRLVFWNICGQTGTIPVKENGLGVALVSGFSPSIVRMVLSNSTDPLECLLEQINSERYSRVEDALRMVV